MLCCVILVTNPVVNVLLGSSKSIVSLQIHLKSNMAVPASDWQRHFVIFVQNYFIWNHQAVWNIALGVLKCCYFMEWFEIQDGCHILWLSMTFFTSFLEKKMLSHQTFQKLSPREILISLTPDENFISDLWSHGMNYKLNLHPYHSLMDFPTD